MQTDINQVIALSLTRKDSAAQAVRLGGGNVEMCFFDCHDVQGAINALKGRKKYSKIAACLDAPCEEGFAMLYDFVDAFVISGYDELSDAVDPLINLRLYNDEYKEIYLRVNDNALSEDMDEVLSYSMLSNIDGLVISNPLLVKEAVGKSGSILKIIADKVDTRDKLELSFSYGATMAIVPYPWRIACTPLRKLLLRKLL